MQFTGELCNDVVLPPWAKSAEDFIHKHRMALVSFSTGLQILTISQSHIVQATHHNVFHVKDDESLF